ncbi:MAG: NADH-quinone oxidoreductase subunit L [Chloroflexi bacterium]|nr:NADH-quinone oxidoreductase subunit L [Chloroflexota bacterium]MQG00777.1 NADH-quinone oxidoreductase subunit L [SAR202 cluster bacterium]|tara:strand:- start:1892 stop:3766 length:1875 start_codon:yes stop_codon:yes gene_type:complete
MSIDIFAGSNAAWLIPALSILAFPVTIFLGRFLPGKGSFISIAAIAAGFILFWFVLSDFLSGGSVPLHVDIDWINIGFWKFTWGFLVDRISVVMLGLITFVALLVQVYSLQYMKGDSRYGWYFSLHALFAGAMLLVVLADNLLFLYFAWELVGLGSYLLIGFWFDRRSAAEAAKKAFITTRIGDVGLLIGIIILFKATGTFHISSIIHVAQNGGISDSTILWSSLLIFLGAMGKSGQFPLHVWLPDAMEGPTPVSALIHAATMVAAGVYLVARMMPLFDLVPEMQVIVAVTGLFTFIFAGFIALVMTDIKRILAYSTISHLGLMMLSIGTGGVGAALLHLVVHGISKALLFLGAGNVMHGTNDETDCWSLGGLKSKMPITTGVFLIGSLSLAGIAPLSGFFSKDEILSSVYQEMGLGFLIVTLAGGFVSALYIARLFFITFTGSSRTDAAKNAHESPFLMLFPVIMLTLVAVFLGMVAIPMGGFKGFTSFVEQESKFHIIPWLIVVSLLIAILGVVVGWLYYGKSSLSHKSMALRLGLLYKGALKGFWIDAIYQFVIDRIVLESGRLIATFDRIVINDTGIDGSAKSVLLSAFKIRLVQTGKIYNYGTAMAFGVFLAVIVWWVF